MKICKNCGRESEEGKIRCPFCGYLFEDEMDSVLREMSLNLNSFKEELTAPKLQQTGISAPAQPSVSAAAVRGSRAGGCICRARDAESRRLSRKDLLSRAAKRGRAGRSETGSRQPERATDRHAGRVGPPEYAARRANAAKSRFVSTYARARAARVFRKYIRLPCARSRRRRLFADPRSERSRCARVCERG